MRFRIVQTVALLILSSFVALVGACGTDEEAGVRVVSTESAHDLFENPPADLVVLDVRTPEEFAEAHLEGAILIDIYEPDFEARVAELDRDVPYLLYCRSGNRSQTARDIMDDLGFSDVSDIDGGISAWISDGYPVVTG